MVAKSNDFQNPLKFRIQSQSVVLAFNPSRHDECYRRWRHSPGHAPLEKIAPSRTGHYVATNASPVLLCWRNLPGQRFPPFADRTAAGTLAKRGPGAGRSLFGDTGKRRLRSSWYVILAVLMGDGFFGHSNTRQFKSDVASFLIVQRFFIRNAHNFGRSFK